MSEPRHAVAAVVLAAGSARRFGDTKPLAPLRGRPLIEYSVDVARAAGIGRILVVVGHDARAVASVVADRGDIEVVRNPDHAAGQASSLRAGISTLRMDREARIAVVLLADQPGLDPEVVRAVVDALETGDADAARARYDDHAGHPVALARRIWPRLLAEVTGDVGAKEVLRQLQVTEVPVDGPSPVDVDEPGDLERLARVWDPRPPPGPTDASGGPDPRQ